MQTEMKAALILIRMFLFRPVLFAKKNCKVQCSSWLWELWLIIFMINFQIYETHIKPIKPTLVKPVKPAGLGFMIKPGFYANPDFNTELDYRYITVMLQLPIFSMEFYKL